jgi:hypothetical protein
MRVDINTEAARIAPETAARHEHPLPEQKP